MGANKSVEGGCLCGKVRFEVTLPSLWCSHCHCSMCRRMHGAGYVTWAGFQSDHFRVIKGDEQLKWYGSSPGARRGFCNTCGSSMLFESERWANETHVALGCMDGPIDRQPEANSFFDAHVDWVPIDDALKAYSG